MAKSTVKLQLRFERLDGRGRRMKLSRKDGGTLENFGSIITTIGQQIRAGVPVHDIQKAIIAAAEAAEAAAAKRG